MIWLLVIVLLVISWAVVLLCITTPDYAALRLWGNRVLLAGNGRALVLLSDELHEDMRTHHKMFGLLPKENYDKLRGTTETNSSAKPLMESK